MVVGQVAPEVGVQAACKALEVPRASFYRARLGASTVLPPVVETPIPSIIHPRALLEAERAQVLDLLHSDRFVDCPPEVVHATLLDEGAYLCSPRTMYRILHDHREVRERRDQLCRPVYARPELLATAPNQVWSWDITKLRGPAKWTYYYLYVILDIFSRYVVGWMIAEAERASLATRLIAETCAKQAIEPAQLTIHADRGASMASKPVAFLLADLGVTKTHSRPHTSNDNPFSESQFKTFKYRPDFPIHFDTIGHGRGFCRTFFSWYNFDHRHSGIAFLTPNVVHHGLAESALAVRHAALMAAYQAHPERFPNGEPTPAALPTQVFINPPTTPAPIRTSLAEAH
jgi:putative transposase